MGFDNILGYLQNKTILITGATGFLGMLFVEKILRVQPNVKKLYLLVRANDAKSATDRMHNEILGKELFRVLREKWREDFDYFITEKVVALPGDVTFENFGVKIPRLMEELYNEIQIILNSAATTNFNERSENFQSELARGLELSGKRFLWVARPPRADGDSGSFFEAGVDGTLTASYLPDRFSERTRGAGLVTATCTADLP